MGCGFYSLHWITSSESAIITFVNPLIVIVLGTFVLGKVYCAYQWLGVAIGFIGVVFMEQAIEARMSKKKKVLALQGLMK